MSSVVDSSVGVKWFLMEKDTDKARRLRDAHRLGQQQPIAPDWFLLEVSNVLGKAAARKIITEAQARQSYTDIYIDAPVLHASRPLLNDAFDLSMLHRRAVYDCLYLGLAVREKCDLITADEALVRQLQPIYGCLVALSSLP